HPREAQFASAGAVPSSSAATIRGETKASGANSRMCRSTFPSRRAITAKLAARPCAKSSIHWRALAIGIRRASRRPALLGAACAGGAGRSPWGAGGTGLSGGRATGGRGRAWGGGDPPPIEILRQRADGAKLEIPRKDRANRLGLGCDHKDLLVHCRIAERHRA